MELTVARHCVGQGRNGLSPLQEALITHTAPIRIAHAPTGAGKSYAFQRAMVQGDRVLFVVPTRRLAQNLIAGLLDSLVREHGWSRKKAESKVAIWSSDQSFTLKEQQGVINIGAWRLRELYGLNEAFEGGEMIVAIPEVITGMLLRPRLDRLVSDTGVFDLLDMFEHIVFDEFHTIETRGFGLAGLLAKLAAEYPGSRAKVSFLSATPLDIRSVLARLDIPKEKTVELHEDLVPEGRAVHGNVRLSWHDVPSLAHLLEEKIQNLVKEINSGRQVVLIFNRLEDLEKQLPFIERTLKMARVKPGKALLVNSLDDSRPEGELGFFSVGRHQRPENFDLLIATSSVEMGVTFRSNLLFMEPGFEPLNFLQRYGRAARGNHDGQVLVRVDGEEAKRQPWLRSLKDWISDNDGTVIQIGQLTEVLTLAVRNRFKDDPGQNGCYFGRLPSRAAYTAGLFWNILMNHPSNKGHRRRILVDYRPQPAKTVEHLLNQVKVMAGDSLFGPHAEKWCRGFEAEACTLRDIESGIQVVEQNGSHFLVAEYWLRRTTNILENYPLLLNQNDVEEIRISGRLEDHWREDGLYIEKSCKVLSPHTPHFKTIKKDTWMVRNWCQEFKKDNDRFSCMARIDYPEAMGAAEKLVRLTGLLVFEHDDSGMEAQSCVL